MALWAPMSDTNPGRPAPQPDDATPHSRRIRWQRWLPPPALVRVTGAIAAITVVGTLAAPEVRGPDGVLFRTPEPAVAGPISEVGSSTDPDAEQSPIAVGMPHPAEAPEIDVPVLRLPGPVPSSGTGSFQYSSSPGLLLGTAGPVRRYRVAVEAGSLVDADQFAAAVDEALGDDRSWTADGDLRLLRVPARADHDFTILLATARTAGRLCAAGGVNIEVGGRPYTSCRVSDKVILNLDRWQLSVDHMVAAGVPLTEYRAYVVNHEVGHELGYRHEGCPRRGAPAPVMMQQTLSLDGCLPNPWPYLHGTRYAGPRV
jgi:Protein of unknown function (DUF3152)